MALDSPLGDSGPSDEEIHSSAAFPLPFCWLRSNNAASQRRIDVLVAHASIQGLVTHGII